MGPCWARVGGGVGRRKRSKGICRLQSLVDGRGRRCGEGRRKQEVSAGDRVVEVSTLRCSDTRVRPPARLSARPRVREARSGETAFRNYNPYHPWLGSLVPLIARRAVASSISLRTLSIPPPTPIPHLENGFLQHRQREHRFWSNTSRHSVARKRPESAGSPGI